MTKTGERIIKSANQAAEMAKTLAQSENADPWDEEDIKDLLKDIAEHASPAIQDTGDCIKFLQRRIKGLETEVENYAMQVSEQFIKLSRVHDGTHCIVPVEPTTEMIEHAATMRMLQERDVHIVYLEMLKKAQGHAGSLSTDLEFINSASKDTP